MLEDLIMFDSTHGASGGSDRAGRRAKRFLSVEQQYEIWLQLVRQELTSEHQLGIAGMDNDCPERRRHLGGPCAMPGGVTRRTWGRPRRSTRCAASTGGGLPRWTSLLAGSARHRNALHLRPGPGSRRSRAVSPGAAGAPGCAPGDVVVPTGERGDGRDGCVGGRGTRTGALMSRLTGGVSAERRAGSAGRVMTR